jgi:hypothetical protein
MKPKRLFYQVRRKRNKELSDQQVCLDYDECGIVVSLTQYDYDIFVLDANVKPSVGAPWINHRELLDTDYNFIAIRRAIAAFDNLISMYPKFQFPGEVQ